MRCQLIPLAKPAQPRYQVVAEALAVACPSHFEHAFYLV